MEAGEDGVAVSRQPSSQRRASRALAADARSDLQGEPHLDVCVQVRGPAVAAPAAYRAGLLLFSSTWDKVIAGAGLDEGDVDMWHNNLMLRD